MHDGNPSKCDIFFLMNIFALFMGCTSPLFIHKPLRLDAYEFSLPALINHHLGETGRVWVTPTWGVSV